MNTPLKNTSGANNMKLQDLSLAELKEIVDGAPEGAEYFEKDTSRYLKVKDVRSDYSQDATTTLLVVWCSNGWTDATLSYSKIRLHAFLTKLSDIRARIAELEPEQSIIENLKQVFPHSYSRIVQAFGEITEPVFKVSDRVVILQDTKALDERYVHFIDDVDYKLALISGEWIYLKNLRHATPEEIVAGHRIDELEAQSNINVTLSAESVENKGVEQPSKVLYDMPMALEYEPDGFNAMSKSCCSTVCKCHEFPIDAELKAPAGMKHDQSKPRYSLIPSGSLEAIIGVLEYGARKYAPDNWKHVENARERYYNASMRHVQAWWSGERLDPETGLPHLAHAVCSLMFLMALKGEQGE